MDLPAFLLTVFFLATTFAAADEGALDLQGKPEDNLRFNCGFHHAVAKAENPAAFVEELKKTNFDPCCLGPELLNYLSRQRERFQGVTMGASSGLKFYFGGREFVIHYTKNQNLRVAVFRHTGYSLSLAVPYGIVVTKGVLVGDCHKIDDYAGWFKTGEAAGMTVNYGMSGHFLDPPSVGGFAGVIERFRTLVNARPTGCNSAGLNSGLTTALLGVSASFYERVSPVVVIRGDRTRKMQNLFRRAAGQAALPEPPGHGAATPPQPRDNFHQTHGQACHYSIPAQLWDNSRVEEVLRNYSSRFGDDGDPNR